MLWVGLALVGGLLVAHGVGWLLYRGQLVAPGHARRVMPSVPVDDVRRDEGWFTNEIRALEDRLLAHFEGGVEGVYAEVLVSSMKVPVAWIEIVLDRLRQEMPCRLRVTRTGRMLHDFAAADVAALRAKKRRARPARALLFAVALLANMGTIWPVITVLLLAGTSLGLMFEVGTAKVGLVGLLSLGAVAVATVLAGWGLHLLLRPRVVGPRLGSSKPAGLRAPKARSTSTWSKLTQVGTSKVGDSPVWLESPRERERRRSSLSWDSLKGGWQFLGTVVVGLLLLLVIAVCLSTVFVWVRGIYRSVHEVEDLEDVPPGVWVRRREWVDTLERFLPTSDLAGRMWRTLRRALRRRRPGDWQMPARILTRAQANGGAISALEIALHEGLDPFEAVEAGARIVQQFDGEIVVLGPGVVGFTFPEGAVPKDPPPEDENLWSEYLEFAPDSPLVLRLPDQPFDAFPVNLVGLRQGHLVGGSRLVAGSCLMVLLMAQMFVLDVPESWRPYLLDPEMVFSSARAGWGMWAVGATAVFASCAMILVASARYVATASALLGIRRDARRAAYQEIVEQLAGDAPSVDLRAQAINVNQVVWGAWPRMPLGMIEPEMLGVAVDLDLEPTPERGEGTWSIEALRADYAAACAAARAHGRPRSVPIEDDAVIFETRIEMDRVVDLA